MTAFEELLEDGAIEAPTPEARLAVETDRLFEPLLE